MRIITLSSIPPRFDLIGPTLESLVAQGGAADAVELYIPRSYRRFPDYDGAPPAVPTGVTVHQPEVDLGPASKILHAVARYKDEPETQLLFCDDDRFYYEGWAAALFAEQAKRPDEAVALSGVNVEHTGLSAYSPRRMPRHVPADRRFDLDYRLRRLKQILRVGVKRLPIHQKPPRRRIGSAGYADIFEGFGGVVVRPPFFDEVAYEIPGDHWAVDDVWLSGMLARRGIPIWLPAGLYEPRNIPEYRTEALHLWKPSNNNRAQLNAHCAHYLRDTYGVWSNATPG